MFQNLSLEYLKLNIPKNFYKNRKNLRALRLHPIKGRVHYFSMQVVMNKCFHCRS